MPQPTATQLHIDTYLTNLSVGWVQDQSKFVANQVFPTVPVMKESDKYAIYDKGFFYRDELEARPMGQRPKQAGYAVSSGTYFCEEFALEHKVDDRVRTNADQPLDPDRAAMRLLTSQAMIHQDVNWAADYFKTGVWGTDWTGVASAPSGSQFIQFDQTGNDPINFFDQRRIDVESNTGYCPNVIVLGADVFRVLKNNSLITDRIKYTQKGIVTAEILAQLFDVDKVLIARGVQNTAKEGQTNAISYIVNRKAALMVYAAPEPTIDEPSGGYTFAWTGLIPGATNALGGVIERGREELAHSDVFQIRVAYDTEIVAPEVGEFFASCVS